MEDKCIVHCEDHSCIHNKGSGYYGVCDIPCPIYCGIDRMYRRTCKNRQTEEDIQEVTSHEDQ